jgi:hypothetical protein
MIIAIYIILLPVCSFILCIFGFAVGRCARKIPILDNNLPRALHRGEIPFESSEVTTRSPASTTCCSRDALSNRIKDNRGYDPIV